MAEVGSGTQDRTTLEKECNRRPNYVVWYESILTL